MTDPDTWSKSLNNGHWHLLRWKSDGCADFVGAEWELRCQDKAGIVEHENLPCFSELPNRERDNFAFLVSFIHWHSLSI